MFSRKRKKIEAGRSLVVAASTPGNPSRAPSIIGRGLAISGHVQTEGELHVDGRIDGDVTAAIVTIGEGGFINGHIRCDEITIYGLLSGSVAAQRAHLVDGCKVNADIVHKVLIIDEGAFFDGHCQKLAADEDASGGDRPTKAPD